MNLSASSAKPTDPTYFLEGIIHDKSEMADFEGPLSLILLLLSKNKIEIRDIKISEILDQYLEYLNAMEKLDLEIASEFVQMASYLLYIKTRMLLTEEKEVTELEQLIASLEQLKCKDTYAAVKSVTPMLDARPRPACTTCRARRSRCRCPSWVVMAHLLGRFGKDLLFSSKFDTIGTSVKGWKDFSGCRSKNCTS